MLELLNYFEKFLKSKITIEITPKDLEKNLRTFTQ